MLTREDVYRETSGTKKERKVVRGKTGLRRHSRDWEIRASSLLETRRAYEPQGGAVLDRLLDAGEVSERGGAFELLCPSGTPPAWQHVPRHILPPP